MCANDHEMCSFETADSTAQKNELLCVLHIDATLVKNHIATLMIKCAYTGMDLHTRKLEPDA